MRVYFFGCWNEPGHHLWGPGGRWLPRHEQSVFEGECNLDGTLAPRRMGRDRRRGAGYLPPGSLCWAGQGRTAEERTGIRLDSVEYEQGQYLHHHLDNGFTALAWWDGCQGDKRGGCSSTILLDGRHDAPAMLAALAEHFPHVLANLKRCDVELVEVQRPAAPATGAA